MDGSSIVTPRDLRSLPVFTEAYADCSQCELKGQCERGLTAYSYRPEKFNGLMIIGEGPGQQEIAEGRPFVGKSGQLLRALLDSIGINMDECYVCNATLCKPPPKDKGLHEEFPKAIPSCLGRLEAEIEAVRPRVIVTVGAASMIAITGYDKTVIKRTAFDCDAGCDENRKVGPVLECLAKVKSEDGSTTAKCGELHFIPNSSKALTDVEELEKLKAQGCKKCKAPFKGGRPKFVKCPACGGRKMRDEEHTYFEHDYNLMAIAGAIFKPGKPDAPRAEHEISSWFGEQGVKYVIPTLHPAFLLRDKQFMAKPVQKHLAKAGKLLKTDLEIIYKYEVTKDPAVVRGWHQKIKGLNVAVDIETEAWDEETDEEEDARQVNLVTTIKCIGFAAGAANGQSEALVVDTRECNPNADDPLLDAIQDLLEDVETPKTYHNGACYDVPVLSLAWGIPTDNLIKSYWDDTLAAHFNLYPDEPHKLAHVTFSFLPAAAWKPPRTKKGAQVHESFEELTLYNARDVIHTDMCREAMGVDGGAAIEHGKMHRAKLHKVYEQDAKIRQIAVSMTMHGLAVDEHARGEAGSVALGHLQEAKKRAIEALKVTRFAFPPLLDENKNQVVDRNGTPQIDFNPFAVKNQLIPALFHKDGFGLHPLSQTAPKNGQSQECTDEADLRGIMLACNDPQAQQFIQAVLDYRDHNKTYKTYITSPKMQPWRDGRVHPIWKPWGAKTGRFSSSPNFQNIPDWLRSLFIAPKGRKIVGADEDQLELRGIAAVTGDPQLITRCLSADETRKLEPEHDPHSYIAALAFGAQYGNLLLKDPAHIRDKTQKCRCQTCKRSALRTITKCLHPDTLVWAAVGDEVAAAPVTLNELRVGELIRAPQDWTEVVARTQQVVDSVHVVTHRGIATCSKNHKWPLEDGRLVEAKDLKVGDVIASCELQPLTDHLYPTVQLSAGAIRGLPTVNIPLSHDWSYLAGLWCGDGSISGTSGKITHGHITKTDQLGCSYKDWQQAIMEAVARVGFIPKPEKTAVVIGDRHAMRVLGALELSTTPQVVGKAKDHVRSSRILRVPSWVRAAGRTAILHFMGGMLDTDGYVSKRDGSMRICTKDPVFAGQLCTLLQAAGLEASIGKDWNKRYKRYYWLIYLTSASAGALGPYMRHPGRRTRLNTTRKNGKALDKTNRVKLIEEAGEQYCCDIQVSSDDHLFMANNMATSNSVIYALNYGAQDAKIHETIYAKGYDGPLITLEMIAHVRRTIYKAYERIPEWREAIVKEAKDSQEVRSPLLGRRRVFPFGDIPATEIYNYPIQSLGADIVNECTIALYEELPSVDPTAFLIAQVHDALYVECDEDKASDVEKLMTQALTTSKVVVPGAPPMLFSASAHSSDNWKME